MYILLVLGKYTYFPYTQEYDEDSEIPNSGLDKAIRAYCAKI